MAKILLIDDDQPVRSGIRDLLEVKDYTVFTVDNGIDGIRIAQEINPDLILCDIMMPVMDGYQVLSELKKEPSTMFIPFVYLTSKIDMADMRYGMGMGADDYIVKPFAAKDLYRSIETRLNKQQMIMQQMINPNKKTVAKPNNENNTHKDHLFLPVGNEIQYIKIHSIECITAFSEYTNVYIDPGKKIVARKFLKEWEKFLPRSTFLRIHRSTIINLDYVMKIEKFFKRSYIVHLKNIKQPFTISQRYSATLKTHNLF